MHQKTEPYDGLPPADAVCNNRPPDRVSETVADICFELAKVTQGYDIAYLTSHVILRVQNETANRRIERISSEQRDRLLCGVALARPLILDNFVNASECVYAKEGVDALRALIALWSEAPEVREMRPGNFYADTHARARWLRNACHNICLREEIDTRATKRRSAVIVRLVEKAA